MRTAVTAAVAAAAAVPRGRPLVLGIGLRGPAFSLLARLAPFAQVRVWAPEDAARAAALTDACPAHTILPDEICGMRPNLVVTAARSRLALAYMMETLEGLEQSDVLDLSRTDARTAIDVGRSVAMMGHRWQDAFITNDWTIMVGGRGGAGLAACTGPVKIVGEVGAARFMETRRLALAAASHELATSLGLAARDWPVFYDDDDMSFALDAESRIVADPVLAVLSARR